jgi:O-antigen/teichoic acid export membrane protein
MAMSEAALEAPVRVAQGRRALDGAGVLSAALLGSGALIYAFHVLAARSLGAEAYGQIAVLWAAVFVVAVVLYRPLEQTASRSVAERRARGEESRSVVRAVALLAAAMLAPLLLVAALGWGSIGDRLFLGDGFMTAALVAGVAIYALAYVTRGVLAGVGWFGGYGLALMADTAGRLALAAPLVLIASRHLAAAALVAAGLLGVLVPALARGRMVLSRLEGPSGPPFRVAGALGFAAPAGVVAAADQLFVNGGALLVVLVGGSGASAAAGVVFAATMLVRVPVYLFQGVATSLLPNLVRLNALADPRDVHRAVARIAVAMLGASALVALPAAAVGPEALRLLYGEGFDAGRAELTLLGVGVGCYLAASTCSQALLALGSTVRAAAAWAAASAVFVGVAVALPAGELMRISVAFAGAAAIAAVVLASLLVRGAAR